MGEVFENILTKPDFVMAIQVGLTANSLRAITEKDVTYANEWPDARAIIRRTYDSCRRQWLNTGDPVALVRMTASVTIDYPDLDDLCDGLKAFLG